MITMCFNNKQLLITIFYFYIKGDGGNKNKKSILNFFIIKYKKAIIDI